MDSCSHDVLARLGERHGDPTPTRARAPSPAKSVDGVVVFTLVGAHLIDDSARTLGARRVPARHDHTHPR